MKNRERYIHRVCEYDMLCKIQATMLDYNCCVIAALSGEGCPHEKMCMLDTCRECLQEWLNKEDSYEDKQRGID